MPSLARDHECRCASEPLGLDNGLGQRALQDFLSLAVQGVQLLGERPRFDLAVGQQEPERG